MRNGTHLCTTGFGIHRNGVGAYLTAGHCFGGDTAWSINGNQSTDVVDNAFGGYRDREAIVAVGSSWLVRVTANNLVVDMEATAGHIFLDEWYNHYGRGSNENNGGTIYAINQDIGFGVWGSASSANCQGGDSGGPVYRFRPSDGKRFPTGIVHGRLDSNSDCVYVALDDQLTGTGWSLK